jgi:hypothetical protein
VVDTDLLPSFSAQLISERPAYGHTDKGILSFGECEFDEASLAADDNRTEETRDAPCKQRFYTKYHHSLLDGRDSAVGRY